MGNEKTNRVHSNKPTSQKHRIRAWALPEWRGNTKQRHRTVVRMDITLKLLQHYHKPLNKDTGQQIKYEMGEFKQEPNKLTKRYKANKKETPQEETRNADQIWEQM